MGYEGDREVMLEEGFEWEEVREGDIGKEEGGGEEEGDGEEKVGRLMRKAFL